MFCEDRSQYLCTLCYPQKKTPTKKKSKQNSTIPKSSPAKSPRAKETTTVERKLKQKQDLVPTTPADTNSAKEAENVKTLMGMGFTKDAAVEAIKNSNNNLQLSINSLLVQSNKIAQIHQYLASRVIDDSVHIACQLLSLEPIYAPCFQLGVDMLRRLSADDLLLSIYLAKGEILSAISFLQVPKTRVQRFNLHDFLSVTLKTTDPVTFSLVYQFFLSRCSRKPDEMKIFNQFKPFAKAVTDHRINSESTPNSN